MAHEPIKLGTRAQVRAAKALDAQRLLELAKERAPNPDYLEVHPPAFWQARASSNRLDFYFTRMRPGKNRTLGNFVRGLKEGVSYLDSHDNRKNGLGQSLDGQLVKTGETDPDTGEEIVEVWGDFFTLSGVNINGHSSDDFIALIGAGVWRDVSVGFFASDIECGICGKQVFDFWAEDACPHFPGLDYEENGKKVTAWAWINDGELSEVSQVYDGASPGAAVVKAEQLSQEGMLDDQSRMRVERRFNTRIALPQRRWALGGVPLIDPRGGHMGKQIDEQIIRDAEELEVQTEEEVIEEGIEDDATVVEFLEATEDEERDTALEAVTDELLTTDEGQLDVLAEERARLAPHGIKLGRNPVEAVRVLGDTILQLRTRLAEQESLAQIGKRYRDDLIEAAIQAGIRAKGDQFKADLYRSMLQGADIDTIRTVAEDLGAEGDALYPSGRVTRDVEEQAPAPADEPIELQVDAEAFSA